MAIKKRNVLFEDVLRDLLGWFKNSPGEFLIIGGIAVSLLARPRTTQDIDVLSLIDESQWDSFLDKGRQFGFEARIKDAMRFAHKNRVLLLEHKKSGVGIDICFGFLPFEEESMKRRTIRRIGTLKVPLPTPEDLMIMKMVAHRPQDMVDVRTILEVYPRLDQKRVRKWVKEFSDVLENPAILYDLQKLFSKRFPGLEN